MGKISVALCIPTYQRNEIVEEFLSECAEYYLDAGMDIYFYDGSKDTKTQEVVGKYQENDRIYYVKRPENFGILMIYEGYGFEKKYDFVWLLGDGVRYPKEVIEQVTNYLKPEYDLICIGTGDGKVKLKTREYRDVNDFMCDCMNRMDYIGASILNAHTMLKNVDWQFYEKEYAASQGKIILHSFFYWNRMAELDDFCAFYFNIEKRMDKWSELKKTSGWFPKEVFSMSELWVNTIERLPDCYTNKKTAMLAPGTYLCYDNMYKFCYYRRLGVYSIKTFFKYRDIWHKITRVSTPKLVLAAITPRWWINFVGKSRLVKFKRFCKSHSRIIIYGAGDTGATCAKYLDRLGIPYEGFCCTNRRPGKLEFRKHPVYVFKELRKEWDPDIGIIVAMEQYQEVIPVLEASDDIVWRNYFHDPKALLEIKCQLGYQYL